MSYVMYAIAELFLTTLFVFVAQEEEDFANFLCEEFAVGLSAIDNGVTKRSYLSKKVSSVVVSSINTMIGESMSPYTYCAC